MTRLRAAVASLRETWLILGLAIVLFAVVELGLTTAFAIRGLWHAPAPNFRGEADTYADRAWARAYYHELDRFERTRTMRWSPYVYWRRGPYRSDFINVTDEGLRQTRHVSPAAAAGEPLKVFMFGGSTMWGLGAGDDSTIPSLVAADPATRRLGGPVDITNFGQYAYVSTQGLLELALQLQKGHVPDAVIFLDGINDTFSAFQLGVPGLPFDEFRREMELNLSVRPELFGFAAQYIANRLSTVRLVNGLAGALGLRGDANLERIVPLQYKPRLPDTPSLVEAVVDAYFNNLRLARTLAASYGFAALFYWQPVIYLKPHLTAYERDSLERDFNYPGMRDFYLQVYDAVRRRAGSPAGRPSGFRDISGIFGESREPIYVDFNHMGERGNRIIARTMAEDLAVELQSRSITRRQNHGVASGDAPSADLLDLPAVERR